MKKSRKNSDIALGGACVEEDAGNGNNSDAISIYNEGALSVFDETKNGDELSLIDNDYSICLLKDCLSIKNVSFFS